MSPPILDSNQPSVSLITRTGPSADTGSTSSRRLKALKAVGWTMVTLGALILAFLAYQLVGTNLVTARAQDKAEEGLIERIDETRKILADAGALPPVPDPPADTSAAPNPVITASTVQSYSEPVPEEGEPLGWISVPSIDLDYILMEGVERATLKSGPGHMPWTPLPGQPGNAVVSGHRTTYGAPFFDLDLLEPGDEITVETAIGRHTYVVRESIIVAPTDVWVTESRPGAWLTLTTCTPKFSARERLIVFAELIDGPNYPYVQQAQERASEDPGSAT